MIVAIRHVMRATGQACVLACAAAFAPALVRQAQAQCVATAPYSSCADAEVRLSTQWTIRLDLSSTAMAFPRAGVAEMDAGYVASPGPSALVQANAGWQLQISAGSGAWHADGVPAAGKPLADLAWGTAEDGVFTPIATTPVAVSSGPAGREFWTTFYFRMRLHWTTDAPASYELPVVYTLTTP